MMAYETIEFQRDGKVAIVRLNRPSVLNAINDAMVHDLDDVLMVCEADPSVRAFILTGSGERAFGAGGDIGELRALGSAQAAARFIQFGQRMTRRMEEARFPTIAAVNGFALGGGCELAMSCDIRIASETAKFGQPEVNLGLMPGFGGTQRTARLLGRGMSMYLCLTGEIIDAHEALRCGLVERVVAPENLMPEALRIANLIASKGPLAIAATKRAIDMGSSLPLASGLELEAMCFATLVDTADFVEGTSAFLEKRKPAFSGS